MKTKINKKSSDILSAEKISETLEDKGIRVAVFDVLDSTNTEARRQAVGGCTAPALIIADSQSAGRGRMGRSFYSPSSVGLYMSVLLNVREDMTETLRLTTLAAVAVTQTIEALCKIKAEIKWVNDIYLNGRKICGILCESFSVSAEERYAVVGIGLNLYTEDFPPQLKDIAASLMPERGMREAFAVEITERLLELFDCKDDEKAIEYYRERSIVIGENIIFTENGVPCKARACDVAAQGRLVVRLDDGKERILSSGEISLKLDK